MVTRDRLLEHRAPYLDPTWGRVSVEHRVKYVQDELMDGRDWLLCDGFGDGVTLYIRKGARTELSDKEMSDLLETAWAGYDALQRIPLQRTG